MSHQHDNDDASNNWICIWHHYNHAISGREAKLDGLKVEAWQSAVTQVPLYDGITLHIIACSLKTTAIPAVALRNLFNKYKYDTGGFYSTDPMLVHSHSHFSTLPPSLFINRRWSDLLNATLRNNAKQKTLAPHSHQDGSNSNHIKDSILQR